MALPDRSTRTSGTLGDDGERQVLVHSDCAADQLCDVA